jgi:CTD kinase subunit gamma
MMDPFELRLYFSNRLKALNPCEDSAEEVVIFALKNRDLDEDLHSCVLEQLENEENNINVRANIVYFLEDLVELARREKYYPYICMIERDFSKIIDHAIPLDGLGVVNVNCVRYVCLNLHPTINSY